MNTPKERIEYRVNKIISDLISLGQVNYIITEKEEIKITVAISAALETSMQKLRNGDENSFKLEDSNTP